MTKLSLQRLAKNLQSLRKNYFKTIWHIVGIAGRKLVSNKV